MIAALYVQTGGVYFGLPDVDPWDEARDARLYDGPWPVVAHPPCSRWGAFAGLVEHVHGYKRGEDGGCFAAALAAVRRFGGVLEHPAYSLAWQRFELPRPITHDGWTGDLFGGWSCYVEQGRYGLQTRKGTWLYAVGCELPTDLRFGYGAKIGGQSSWYVGKRGSTPTGDERMRGARASATPEPMRDVLLAMARSARVPASA